MRRDKKLLRLFKEEKYSCPADLSSSLDNALQDLRKTNEIKNNYNMRFILRVATIVCAIAIFVLPNLNSTIAHAMQEIPIIGEFIKVITVRQYEKEDNYHPQDVEIPEIVQDDTASNLINADIKELTDKALFMFKEESEALPDSHTGIVINYEVVTNTKEWFTIKLLIHHEAGSGTTEYKYYHIDKMSGESVVLSSLFDDDFDYVTAISENVAEQMIKRNEQLESEVYWVDSTENPDWSFSAISPDQNFYFDENGELTLVFDKYQIAPGYMGTPTFTIPNEIYKNGLK